MNENYTCKNYYKVRLTKSLNDVMLQCFEESNCKTKLVVVDCNERQSNSHCIYQFMVPIPLFKKWKSFLSAEFNLNDKIKDGLEKLKKLTTSWTISLSQIHFTDSIINFQIVTKSLVEVLIKRYSINSVVGDFANLSLCSKACQKIVVICYLTDDTAIRSLLLASMIFDDSCVILQVSKRLLRTDINSLLQSFSFDFEFANSSSVKVADITDIFAQSPYFHQENEMIVFEKECIEQFVSSCLWFEGVLNTKLHLTPQIFDWICDMETILLSCEAEKVSANIEVYHVGAQDDKLFAKQLGLSLLVYLDQHNKWLLPVARRLFSSKNELFHGPIKTVLAAEEILENYRESLSHSFASKYGENGNWVSLVKAMAPSVMKLDLMSVSLSSSINQELFNCNNSSANFVMYNYCRLATLLKSYNEKVEYGFYPPLPDVETVDFSLLQEENELKLIDQIWKFGDVQVSSIDCLHLDSFKPHLLVSYAKHLCRLFSTFYNRYHILGANLSHLLPLMHARIYLVKAVQHILKIFFDVFRILPLEHM